MKTADQPHIKRNRPNRRFGLYKFLRNADTSVAKLREIFGKIDNQPPLS